MFLLTTLTILTVTASTVDSFQEIKDDNLKGFLISFRQVLLEKVAVEVNKTLESTDILKEEIEKCKPLLQKKADECKVCAKDQCKQSPTFEDYLKLANPYLYLKDPLDNIGNKLEDAIDLVGEHAGGFYNYMKDLGESFASGELFEDAFAELNKHLHLDLVTDFFKDIFDDILNLDDLFGDIFGKKRRRRSNIERELRLYRILAKIYPKLSPRETIDPELKQCMEQHCSSCRPMLKPTQEETITAVCGDTIATMNATIHAQVLKMQTVYNYTLDKDPATVIVKMLELNPATYNFMTGEVSEVYITAYLASEGTTAYKRYKTEVAYLPLQVDVSARNMGLEYWDMTEVQPES